MDLRSTGIPGLDELLRGGVPEDGLTLILGDAGSGKSTLARQFLWEGIHTKEHNVTILSETHRASMKQQMLQFGWDITPYEGDNLLIIEGFYLAQMNDTLLAQLEDASRELTLTTLNLDKLMHLLTSTINQLGPSGRCIFDSLSDLFILLGDNLKVLRFLRRAKVFLAGNKYSTVVTLDPHTQGTVATRAAMHMADGIVEIRLREGEGKEGLQREIRISAMPQGHDSAWHPLEITKQGVKVTP